MAKISKTVKLAQPVAKKTIFPENTGTNLLDHLLLMLSTYKDITYKDIRDTKYTLQGVIVVPRYPEDQDMPLT